MANKYDLQIIQKVIGGAAVSNVLPAVPPGKTRFICFVKMNMNVHGVAIINSDTIGGAATVVDTTDFTAAGILAFPDKVDVDNPLFSIAEGRFLNIQGDDAGAVGNITFVYFDE